MSWAGASSSNVWPLRTTTGVVGAPRGALMAPPECDRGMRQRPGVIAKVRLRCCDVDDRRRNRKLRPILRALRPPAYLRRDGVGLGPRGRSGASPRAYPPSAGAFGPRTKRPTCAGIRLGIPFGTLDVERIPLSAQKTHRRKGGEGAMICARGSCCDRPAPMRRCRSQGGGKRTPSWRSRFSRKGLKIARNGDERTHDSRVDRPSGVVVPSICDQSVNCRANSSDQFVNCC